MPTDYQRHYIGFQNIMTMLIACRYNFRSSGEL